MDQMEIDSFVRKFKNLNHNGRNATLTIKTMLVKRPSISVLTLEFRIYQFNTLIPEMEAHVNSGEKNEQMLVMMQLLKLVLKCLPKKLTFLPKLMIPQ